MSSWIRRSWNTSSGWPLRRGTRPNTASATSPSTSATARARALRSTSSSPVARWPISVAAGTSPVRTYRTSRSMSCAIASCCPSRLSRRRSPPTTSSAACSRGSRCRPNRCRNMSPSTPERRLRRLEWTVVRRLDGLLQGDYRTIFKGHGLDLADIREYAVGDDVRHIDWNVTARLDTPYVREYLEDREISAHFLLDLSPSVDFGTVDRRKRDLLLDFTGVLARLLTRHGNRVGATLYGSRLARAIPDPRGTTPVLRPRAAHRREPRPRDRAFRLCPEAARSRSRESRVAGPGEGAVARANGGEAIGAGGRRMSFIWPSALLLLAVVAVLVVLYVLAQRRRNRYALRYANLTLVREAVGKGPGWRRHVPPAFFLLALACMSFAVARPQATVAVPSQEGTVILTIDVSGSMLAEDMKPNRMEAAKAAARAFVDRQNASVRIGVVSVSGDASIVQSPTTDRNLVTAAINRLRPQRATAIGRAILVSLDAIFEGSEDELPSAILQQQAPGGAPRPTATPLPAHLQGQHAAASIV